jgi:cytochrome c
MNRKYIILASIIYAVTLPSSVLATKQWALKTRKDCTYCHLTVTADAPLNSKGRFFRENSHSLSAPTSNLENKPMEGTLTESGIKLLTRKYHLKGERLFNLDKIGSNRIDCNSCHKEGLNENTLAGVWDKYPKYHHGLNRMADIEDAVNYCITERMKGSPLRPGTRSSLAMQIYLKSLSSQ